jgi:hypothetical protein
MLGMPLRITDAPVRAVPNSSGERGFRLLLVEVLDELVVLMPVLQPAAEVLCQSTYILRISTVMQIQKQRSKEERER